MADKKKESNDVPDAFDNKELEGIIKGFGEYKKIEDKKEFPNLELNLAKSWEDSYQNNLKEKLEKKFKDKGGLAKKLEQQDESDLKEVAHDFFMEYLENAHKHTNHDIEKGYLNRLKNLIKEQKTKGKDAYSLSSSIYHNLLGLRENDKEHMDNIINSAIAQHMTGAEFLNYLQNEIKGEHVGRHRQRVERAEFEKKVGNHDPIKYQAAVEKFMKNYDAKVDNHGLFMRVNPQKAYQIWKNLEHGSEFGEKFDYESVGVKYKPIKAPKDDKK